MTNSATTTITISKNLAPSAANTTAAAGLLKILVAAQATGATVQWSDADASSGAQKSKQPYWVVLEGPQTKLYDPNATVRYLYKIWSLPLGERLAVEQLLEWEEKCLSILSADKELEAILTAAEPKVTNLSAAENNGTVSAANTVLFGTLYYALFNAKSNTLTKYPALQQWYSRLLESPAVAAALPAYSSNVVNVLVREEATLENRNVNMAIAYSFDPSKIILPEPGAKNVLITSALPYVNNVPHLGNMVGSTLSADVFARYSRIRGNNTLYICGTDEYGTTTEIKALEEKLSCQQLCDKYHTLHKEIYDWFKLSFDYFGRTSTKKQTEIVQGIFLQCYQNGYVSSSSMEMPFCETCNRFLADRFVEGTCPRCGYDDARGDQCDNCNAMINATELINARCKIDGNRPVIRESKHLFLDLDRLQPKCEELVNRSSVEGAWSSNSISITRNWLKEGLRPRCITRDLKWGVPVPLEGFDTKVFYVWFDACIGYPSITANYTDEWEKWWKNPDDVKLYQFMGKDNVPFHTVVFPSTEIATGDNWTYIHNISACEYLNYESGKFSKSRGVGVFGNNARDTGVSADVWRYFLLANRPETSDTMFAWNDFVARNNSELLANLGNFCNRVIKFLDGNTKYAGVLPAANASLVAPGANTTDRCLIDDVNALLARYIEQMDAVHIRSGLRTVMDISARGNLYLQESKLDNTLFSEHRAQCDTVLAVAANLIYLLSAVLHPFMPDTAAGIARQLNAPERILTDTFELELRAGHVIGKAEYLFTRIDEKKIDEWRAKYSGGQADTADVAAKVKKPKTKGDKIKGKTGSTVAITQQPAAN
ncbi:methionine--tRNA ligase mes1 [Coemansia spiralis]|uniref:methionine--tRNA ligase n=2 Tax=Coemansia TaxID=4863 RepID=A0A9W8G9F9_9FUNG|nr:tRNA synthetases class I (M)-domain-containing protein [Coemansia spiralis]KAJ1991609.1 methionine--tRNA ligase mes1 [Coemansia umbellata]KAJ2623969.1 methionine--tRNA ligase mes1 [Coemansia sp. RSA 1358]KAJ2679244.1 methionine--tRNA ligase mes1 [Coemansia spiralis]